ncbi:ABC transporter permease [Aureimonas sp. AU4]|uniref:ABC transporter permease n=1 Tax=Aureimonas sp. AU4 TaxID=1638163 RepID=UPI0009EA8372|nr:ABC transporter permease [Aureimonas sp. AU4]
MTILPGDELAAEQVAEERTGGGHAGRIASRLLKTLFSLLVTLFGLVLVTFAIARLVPIDPVLAVVGERATAAQYEAARTELGLDQPIPVQFARYLGEVARGDFGRSVTTSQPVLDDVLRVFPATLELATLATLLGVLLGVPAGVVGAVNQGRWPDHVLRVVGLLGYSMPVFWLGLVALLLFYGHLGWTGGPGRLDVAFELSYEFDVTPRTGSILVDSALSGAWDVFRNALSHIVLPVCVLGAYSMAYISRMTRSFMLEQLGQEYVTTARVKGVSERRVVWVHALGNAAVPLITVIALSYAALLEGSVLTETVFAWPGLGLYITQALFAADLNAVLGGTLVIGCAFILLNILSDLVYTLVDPRAR